MSEIPEDIKVMEERIAAIKKKNEKKEQSGKHTDFSQASIVLQLALELVSGPIVGASIGYILDEVFDTKSVFLLIFTILGGFAGLINVARYMKRNEEKEKEK